MEQSDPAGSEDFISLTADVVSAYVTKNSIQKGDLPSLIAEVHASFQKLTQPAPPEPVRPTPPISAKKSITPDHLISMEDGRKYKSLKRHLTGRGLTPQQYREKWGLPSDYPMVAPNYAKQRSELARAAGLGQQRRKNVPKAAAGSKADVVTAPDPTTKKGGRSGKSRKPAAK
jgi:predicted transcriptional regulator